MSWQLRFSRRRERFAPRWKGSDFVVGPRADTGSMVDWAVFVMLSALGMLAAWANVAGLGWCAGGVCGQRRHYLQAGWRPKIRHSALRRYVVVWTVLTLLSTVLVATLAIT